MKRKVQPKHLAKVTGLDIDCCRHLMQAVQRNSTISTRLGWIHIAARCKFELFAAHVVRVRSERTTVHVGLFGGKYIVQAETPETANNFGFVFDTFELMEEFLDVVFWNNARP